MAENGDAADHIGRRRLQSGLAADGGVLAQNIERRLGIGDSGDLLRVESEIFRHRHDARAVDQPAGGIDAAVEVEELFRRQHVAGGDLDHRALHRGHRQHRVGHEHQLEVLVGAHQRVDVAGGLAAKRAIEVVELQDRDVAREVADRDLAGQRGDARG
ncbi:MAG TPA: hypothetical protein VG475_18145, partial [Pseudolabrys sp.]|nr:hypothetical protein [Pseudolabrys sp.]